MTLMVIQVIFFQLVLPAVFIFSLWKGSFQSKIEWIVQVIFAGLFTSWLFFSTQWAWFSYYLRFLWLILLILAIYNSWKKARALPFRINYKGHQKWSIGVYAVLILIFGMYNIWIFSGYTTKDDAIELEFPLKNGTYYVGQGGNHVQVNYHNAYPSQQYALDILKLNKFGIRAAGIYPKELDKYNIYGDELYSPCTGKILEVRNDLPDLTPPEADSKNPSGNYVNIKCDGEVATVLIAHMQEGSVVVEEGESVEKGQQLGLVGNSGNTSEPHLHIHAEKDGKGVPIRFDGKFLVRNSLVR